jgi:hypothetical protein
MNSHTCAFRQKRRKIAPGAQAEQIQDHHAVRCQVIGGTFPTAIILTSKPFGAQCKSHVISRAGVFLADREPPARQYVAPKRRLTIMAHLVGGQSSDTLTCIIRSAAEPRPKPDGLRAALHIPVLAHRHPVSVAALSNLSGPLYQPIFLRAWKRGLQWVISENMSTPA